jgi:hypothetical protein
MPFPCFLISSFGCNATSKCLGAQNLAFKHRRSHLIPQANSRHLIAPIGGTNVVRRSSPSLQSGCATKAGGDQVPALPLREPALLTRHARPSVGAQRPRPMERMRRVDQWISGSVVEGAPTEEPRPDASNARSQQPAPEGNWCVVCLVLLPVC